MTNKLNRVLVAFFTLVVLLQYAGAASVARVSVFNVYAPEFLAFNPFSPIVGDISSYDVMIKEQEEYAGSEAEMLVKLKVSYSCPAIRIPARPSFRSVYRPPLN